MHQRRCCSGTEVAPVALSCRPRVGLFETHRSFLHRQIAVTVGTATGTHSGGSPVAIVAAASPLVHTAVGVAATAAASSLLSTAARAVAVGSTGDCR